MRKNISVGALILAVICAFASCGTGDSYSTSTSDNAAITAFTLGTFKDTLTVLDDDGNVIKKTYQPTVDSVIVTTYTGSTFAICIDQLAAGVDGEAYGGRIYNTDSLPYNSHMKMLATVSAKDNGTVIYQEWSKDPDTEDWTYYYSTDSIDFTNSLRFRVISSDVTNYKDYKVDIKRHNERAGIYEWYTPIAETAFVGSSVLKGVSTSEGLYVLCDKGLYKSTDNSKSWTKVSGAAVGQSLVAQGTDVYVLNNLTSKLYLNGDIVDGAAVSDLKYLAAAGTNILCAVSTGNKFMESIDGGMTWSEASVNNNECESFIPVKDICYTVAPSSTNDQIEQITIIGNMDSSQNISDTCAVIWNKEVKRIDGTKAGDWALTMSSTFDYCLPRLTGLSSCAYNNTWLLAIGGNPEVSGINSTAYDRIYVSRQGDNGITWERVTGLKLPTATEEPDKTGSLLMSDYKGQYFYFIVPASGNVWHGKLNEAVWEKKDK